MINGKNVLGNWDFYALAYTQRKTNEKNNESSDPGQVA
jgi:hypothetical protein